ncbi:MAG TPA: tetratricopeptide repeat protein, partial [Bacteroidales bacterium]|nr:tetratricopeptide repeat protein [Bacteroidales bacterium]
MNNLIIITKYFFLIMLLPIISISQESSIAYINAGNEFLQQKKYAESIEMFDKAIELSPLEPRYYIYRGVAKYYMQEYKEAIIDFTRTIEIQPDYAEAYNLRGIAKG